MKLRKFTALFLMLILTLGLVAGCGKKSSSAGDGDSKAAVKIILVLEDESEKEYDINVTPDSTLRDALYEAELISEDTYYAMFVEDIDGNVADVMNDGCTWLPTDTEGNQITGSFDEITVSDGQTIKLVYTVVPTFDD